MRSLGAPRFTRPDGTSFSTGGGAQTAADAGAAGGGAVDDALPSGRMGAIDDAPRGRSGTAGVGDLMGAVLGAPRDAAALARRVEDAAMRDRAPLAPGVRISDRRRPVPDSGDDGSAAQTTPSRVQGARAALFNNNKPANAVRGNAPARRPPQQPSKKPIFSWATWGTGGNADASAGKDAGVGATAGAGANAGGLEEDEVLEAEEAADTDADAEVDGDALPPSAVGVAPSSSLDATAFTGDAQAVNASWPLLSHLYSLVTSGGLDESVSFSRTSHLSPPRVAP